MSSVRATAKQAYVATAHGIGRGLARVGVPDAPPPRSHRTRHWLHSLTRVHDAAAMVELDVPWWTYRAIDEIELWLSARPRPARVFEYGAGASTVWLARRCGEVTSVEHDPAFVPVVERLLTGLPHATVRLRPATTSAHPVVPSAKEGCAGLDFASYVAAIDELDGDLDLVVIDGRAREACLERALPRLADGGLVVFDNSWRRRYRRALAAAPVAELRLRGLTPTLPYPDQTSVVRPV